MNNSNKSDLCIKRSIKKKECHTWIKQMSQHLALYFKPNDEKYKDIRIEIKMYSIEDNGLKDNVFSYIYDASSNTETYTKPKDCTGTPLPDAYKKTTNKSVKTYFDDMVEWFCYSSSWYEGHAMLKVNISGENIECRNKKCEALFEFQDDTPLEIKIIL